MQNMYLRGQVEDEPSELMANGKRRARHIYRLHIPGRSEKVCKKYFCAIHGIKDTRLKRKVIT